MAQARKGPTAKMARGGHQQGRQWPKGQGQVPARRVAAEHGTGGTMAPAHTYYAPSRNLRFHPPNPHHVEPH